MKTEKLQDSVVAAWGEHPELSLALWKHEVANDRTRQGYWPWVGYQLTKIELQYDAVFSPDHQGQDDDLK